MDGGGLMNGEEGVGGRECVEGRGRTFGWKGMCEMVKDVWMEEDVWMEGNSWTSCSSCTAVVWW